MSTLTQNAAFVVGSEIVGHYTDWDGVERWSFYTVERRTAKNVWLVKTGWLRDDRGGQRWGMTYEAGELQAERFTIKNTVQSDGEYVQADNYQLHA